MRPMTVDKIWEATKLLRFPKASEPETGSLLRTLAASKPKGRLLELGTGTGLGTAWILDGMGALATLDSVDNSDQYLAVAREFLDKDPRVTFHEEDAALFIKRHAGESFDYIFADTWAGKFTHLEETLALLAPGGVYVIDDLLPQPSWPAGHGPKVPRLVGALKERKDLHVTRIDHGTGMLVAVRYLNESSRLW